MGRAETEGGMRLLGKALIALAMAGGALIIGAPAQSAELKAEGSIPGLSVVVQDLKRDEANSVTLRFQLINASRSEEHTSELQSHSDLVCRLLLEKKKKLI